MNPISYRRLSFVVSLATVTVLGSGFEAQSETIAPTRSTEAPTPGTTATFQAAALADQLAESASVTFTPFRVAQATEPSPGTPVPTTPAPTTPAPTTSTPAVSFADVDPNILGVSIYSSPSLRQCARWLSGWYFQTRSACESG